ncbi:hypothetical protein JXA12_03910 [Candidatus Woesearchaeota archaeon]|nr:hypothetical protein [Candidatus Woesearchaeota archaeon]
MYINAERLREKGWSEAEIKHAQRIVNKAKRHKHPHHHLLDEAIYWGVLFLAIGTIIANTYWVIPLFFFSKSTVLYPVIIIMALAYGTLFSHVIKDLEHLERHHHIIFSAAIPITSITSFFLILTRMKDLEAVSGIKHGIALTAVIFTIFFILPYLYELTQRRK